MGLASLIKGKSTAYNLEICPAPRASNVPEMLYNLGVKAFEKAGFNGKKHIDITGRMHDCFDNSCKTIKKGSYDIFYHSNINESMGEMCERAGITASGFDDEKMKAVEMGKEASKILEKHDALVSLPWSIYRQMPLIENMEINTPAGIQSLHVHTEEGKIIQFIKPEKEKDFYDYDTLKNYLFDSLYKFIESRFFFRNAGKARRLFRLYEMLRMDPHSVKRVGL